MIVVALTLDYPPRRFIGSEMATHAMLRHLAARGHEVTVALTSRQQGEPWDHEGVTVTPGLNMIRSVLSDADVVVTHVDISPRRLRGLHAPLVGITHNAREHMADPLTSVDWSLIVHNAHATATAFDKITTTPHIVIHPPVDYRDWQVDRSLADSITLVNVTGEKGSDTFYELAERMPDRRFLGVLGGWGAADVRDLPNVELRAHGTDMRAVYAETRILLMASEHESWGRVAVEAMSSGIPVLATDLPGPRECVGDGGVLVELNWWDEFERQIRLLDDEAHYSALSAAAVDHAMALDPGPELDLFADSIEALAADTWERSA